MKKFEKNFQRDIVNTIKLKFPESIVMKMDARAKQGIPDLLILYKDKWAALECKRHKNAHIQPNQKRYVEKMNNMSYASFIYPENKEKIFDELEQTFRN